MPFELWRLDDNGNRFLVATFADRAAAEQRLRELTRAMHKQTYWIVAKPARPGEEGPVTLPRRILRGQRVIACIKFRTGGQFPWLKARNSWPPFWGCCC